MKKFFIVAILPVLAALVGCNPVQFPVTLVAANGQSLAQPPVTSQVYLQQPPQAVPVQQVAAQAPQQIQQPQVAYAQATQMAAPAQPAISVEQMQQFEEFKQFQQHRQMQQQPVAQPLPQYASPMRNVGYAQRQVEPQYKGKVAGCDLFEMELDTGPVTMAKCKGADGPVFVQVSPATLNRANMDRPDGDVLMFQDRNKKEDVAQDQRAVQPVTLDPPVAAAPLQAMK